MATVGQQLTAPEAGWKRYDDTHPAFKYIGSWTTASGNSSWYQSTIHSSSDMNAKVQFKFIGTSLRIIAPKTSSGSNVININIDGITETYSLYNNTTTYQVLVYEKQGLINREHTVEIRLSESGTLSFDAIDIDDTGRLLHPDEVLDPKDLDIGKRIRCHYQASSGQVGVFSGLGQETSDFIPVNSSATPNGDFYFICVDKDYLGRWKLIADRNIQHSISWDNINEQGMTNTGREITF
jgi:Carbohydrate esterase 2 N-terminal